MQDADKQAQWCGYEDLVAHAGPSVFVCTVHVRSWSPHLTFHPHVNVLAGRPLPRYLGCIPYRVWPRDPDSQNQLHRRHNYGRW